MKLKTRDWPIIKALQNGKLVMALTKHSTIWIYSHVRPGVFSGQLVTGEQITVRTSDIVFFVTEGLND